MAIATDSDVVTALGRPLTEAEEGQVNWWLAGVELFITARLGPVAGLDPAAVAFVEAEAVAEKVRRRGSAESSITVSVDDGSITRRYDNQVSASDITDEWWNLLDPNHGTGARSIRPSFEADTAQHAPTSPTGHVEDWPL